MFFCYLSITPSKLLCLATAITFSSNCLAQERTVPFKGASPLSRESENSNYEKDNGIAGRVEREQSASQVMNSYVSSAQEHANLQAQAVRDAEQFNETVKRLNKIENNNPAYALSQYRQFLVGREITPVVGVQIALKIAQLRQKLNDLQGAWVTCDLFAKKFALAPTSSLLKLEQARVLMRQNQLVQASQCVDDVLPQLMGLGAPYYLEISKFLLQLAHQNISQNQEILDQEKARTRIICASIEKIYFYWLKKDTVDHLWERFVELGDIYKKVGDEQGANTLLRKVCDITLQIPLESKNTEGAVVSLEIARWLTSQGEDGQAKVFYSRALAYKYGHITELTLTDQGQELLSKGQPQAALELIGKESPKNLGFGPQWILAQAYWQMEDWSRAEDALLKAQSMNVHSPGIDATRKIINAQLELLRYWKNKTYELPVGRIKPNKDEQGLFHVLLDVKSLQNVTVCLDFISPKCKLYSFDLKGQKRDDTGIIVRTYEMVFKGEEKGEIRAFVSSFPIQSYQYMDVYYDFQESSGK